MTIPSLMALVGPIDPRAREEESWQINGNMVINESFVNLAVLGQPTTTLLDEAICESVLKRINFCNETSPCNTLIPIIPTNHNIAFPVYEDEETLTDLHRGAVPGDSRGMDHRETIGKDGAGPRPNSNPAGRKPSFDTSLTEPPSLTLIT